MNKTKGLKFAVLLVVFVAVSVDADGTHDWNYYYKEALSKRVKGDYDGALADLERALKLAPDKQEIYTARGVVYEKTGNFAAAMADYEFALTLNPNSPETLHNIMALKASLEKSGNPIVFNVASSSDLTSSTFEEYEDYDDYENYEDYGDYDSYDGYDSYESNDSYAVNDSYESNDNYEGNDSYAVNEDYKNYGAPSFVHSNLYYNGGYGIYRVIPPTQSNPYGNGSYGGRDATPTVQGDTNNNEGYESYGATPIAQGDPNGNAGYESYSATPTVQGDPNGNAGYGSYSATPTVQGNKYNNGSYGIHSVLPPAQSTHYSGRGVVSFFPEQGTEEGSVPASQPVKAESQIRTVAMPISEKDTRNNGNATFVKATVNGIPDKTVIIQQGDAVPDALNRQFCNPSAGDSVVVKIIVNGNASIKLEDGRVFQQESLKANVNTPECDGKTPVSNTPVQKVFIDPIAETYNNCGAVLYRQGLYNEAVLQFDEAIKAYPNYAIAYNNRGLAFIGKGDFERAALDFERALRINPYYRDARLNRSTIINSIAQR